MSAPTALRIFIHLNGKLTTNFTLCSIQTLKLQTNVILLEKNLQRKAFLLFTSNMFTLKNSKIGYEVFDKVFTQLGKKEKNVNRSKLMTLLQYIKIFKHCLSQLTFPFTLSIEIIINFVFKLSHLY